MAQEMIGLSMIRQATVADIPEMEGLAREFYAAAPVLGDFRMELFGQVWEELLEAGAGVIFLNAEGETVTGAIGGIRHRDLYSNKLLAVEMFWFVSEDCRGTAGARLLTWFERWAQEQGCQEVQMVHLATSMPERLRNFYERIGYTAIETRYSKRLEPARGKVA